MAPRGLRNAAQRRLRSRAKSTYHRARRGGPPKAVLVVLGCQRSGTTALMRTLELDWNAKVFPEFSPLNRDPELHGHPVSAQGPRFGIRLRPLDHVADVIRREPYPLVVCKPLVESQRAHEILNAIDGARCLWMFRHYRDVAESVPRTWPDAVHQRNLEPIVDAEEGNWRSESVADDVRALVRRHYAADMNPYDGGALFWYARNRLLFDLGLANDPRVMTLQYERFAAEPSAALELIYEFAGARFPGQRIARQINPRTVGRGEGVALAAEIEEHCDALWRTLGGVLEADS